MRIRTRAYKMTDKTILMEPMLDVAGYRAGEQIKVTDPEVLLGFKPSRRHKFAARVDLTPNEARALARRLLRAADKALGLDADLEEAKRDVADPGPVPWTLLP